MSNNWKNACVGKTIEVIEMDRGLVTLIGMSIAYAASFLGLGLAWWSWRKRHQKDDSA
jgi:hypothetical protein